MKNLGDSSLVGPFYTGKKSLNYTETKAVV